MYLQFKFGSHNLQVVRFLGHSLRARPAFQFESVLNWVWRSSEVLREYRSRFLFTFVRQSAQLYRAGGILKGKPS